MENKIPDNQDTPTNTESENALASMHRCSLPITKERSFDANFNPRRAQAILMHEKKWVNGTVLNYYFFDKRDDGDFVYFSNGQREWRSWVGSEAQKEVVRAAFKTWKEIGIGLAFKEVDSRRDAEIRIGFMRNDGAWSYIGRDVLNIGTNQRTMNFGWDIARTADGRDTALHEIGHTLGFPHEHQNPNAGIVWNEEEVYRQLALPPNNWPREQTHFNIIRKINPDSVQGSNWDADSIMHYPFEAGMIRSPRAFQNGLRPAGGLSERDKVWVKVFYPPIQEDEFPTLEPLKSVTLNLKSGEQKNFIIRPKETKTFNISTFGRSDTVLVLFEEEDGELQYRSGDDDSGEDFNANIKFKLIKDHKYILRVRLYFSDRGGETAVMIW